ncbi:pentapeptide repeat-containing protein [Saccharopolyspora dendranthemae]|uniref:Pentapeptide repeat protein n=1 Tax=Saccharopolyspora dendranthemae TaxID=1181886 RepID=A0A561U5Z4_9PSEU|nr:pentapeptide repeat-containing protein [Saccharopolyspora dendranthemae]TWF94780.1 pentapeptide repeat protein [Saccharopolyspora dendranthemae]
MGERKIGLVLTIALAVVVLCGVSAALLLFDPRTTGADALRTGGLAAGSVVALYALWLNDRRRRVEEERQTLERRRTDLERDRVADERFARAIELLGHETDQVRVGALHALAGLAHSNPGQVQTVLDVLCSYLRRPFQHPRYSSSSTGWTPEQSDEAERQLQVRLTAQRLIADLLPGADDIDAPVYDLDLTGATLEYFELSDRKVGTVLLRYAHLFSSNNLSRSVFHGHVYFSRSTFGTGRLSGRFRCDDAVFHRRAWFPGVHFGGPVRCQRSTFRGPAKFADSTFTDEVTLAGSAFEDLADFDGVLFQQAPNLDGTSGAGEVPTGTSPAPQQS